MPQKNADGFLRIAAESFFGSVGVALITLLCWRLQLRLPTPTCLYLLVIVLLSMRCSFATSAVVSFFAVGCLDYFFIPPIYSFTVSGPNDIVALGTFLTVSAIITHLVSRLRKLMQEKLRQSEAYLSEAQRLSHTGSFGWRTSRNELLTGELRWSEETFRIFQCDESVKPTVGLVLERTHPEDIARVKQTIERALQEGKDFTVEHRLQMPDGSVKHVSVVAHANGDKSGNLEFIGAVMDVTVAKKAEEELRQSERRYAVTLTSIGDAVIATDDSARVTFMNRVAAMLTGWQVAEAIGRPISEVFHIINEESREVVEDPAAKVLRLGTIVGLANHTALLARDGRELPIDDSGSPIIDDSGNITGVVLVFRDMTQRRAAEDAELLRRSKERLELAVHGSNLSIWEFDMPDGRIENSRSNLVNVWELLGYDPLTAPTDFASVIALEVHPEDLGRLASAVNVFLAGEDRTFEAEYRVRHKDGTDRWRLTRGVAVRSQEGRALRFIGSCVDITDLKRAEEALRKSEHRFRAFVDHATDAFFLHGEGFVVVDVNRQACERLGYARDELLGMTPLDFDPDISVADLAEIDRKLSAGETMAFESRHRRKDGTVFPVEIRGRAFWEGDRRFSVALARDITERKRAEEALRESEERFRGTFEHASVGIANVDFEGRWLRVNQRLCDILGYSSEELLQKTFQELTYVDDLPLSLEKFIPFKRGELPNFSLQKRYVRKDGSLVWVELFDSLQRDAAGEPAYAIVMLQDISERKRLEGELRESEHRWRSLTEMLPQLVWTATPDGACDYFSTQWTQHTGIAAKDLLGWRWLKSLHPDDRERTRRDWTAAVQGPGAYDVEYRVRRLDGEYRWFKTRGVPIKNSDGRIFKWFGTCTDITTGKQLEEELRQANRAKDEFLANVSHEIRTPMNAILGLTALVLGTQLDEGQRQSLTTVKSAGNDLLRIINDLLDFSKIEAGKLELDRAEFSLRAALGDTLRALAIRAHQKGLELVSNVLPDVPDALIGDAGRLRQVLLNIIGNAIKFTDQGEVVVQVSCISDAARSNDAVQLLFRVRDTGIGIPREKHAAIFRAFEQEDSSTTRRFGGTGLGLTIAAQLVSLMGGKITVESEPGRGSTFSVMARFERSAKEGALVTSRSADLLENLRVLIVDDNLTNRQILEEWLHDWRMRPVAVSSGAAAVEALHHAGETGRPYSLVLMDGRMPDADGASLISQFHQRMDVSSTRMILLTSDATTINTGSLREMGISAHLVKPVQQSELLETIRHVMSHTLCDAPPTTAAAPLAESEPVLRTPVPLKILVAEDNEFNVTLLKQLFDRKGHRARIAGDGREALELATVEAFDVLLLDIHLPEMDGFAVAQAIREQERDSGKHLPIIAFTARSGKQDRERCLAAGMDDFLSKPVQAEALWTMIGRVAARRAPQTDSGSELLDSRVLLAACDCDAVVLETICQIFRARVPDQLISVQNALRDADAMRLREAAHKLSGMLATFSTVAGNAACGLEDLAAQLRLVEAGPLVKQLETMTQKLLDLASRVTIESLRKGR